MLKILLLFTLLASPAAVLAQKAATKIPTAAELKKNVLRVRSSIELEDQATEQLMTTTARQLVAYLRAHELSAREADNLGLSLAAATHDAAHFKVYTYSYQSGGTRGTIHRPVFQWRNAAGQLFAYHSHEECEFIGIYRLSVPGRTMYLLLGGDQGDSQCYASTAYVVELKGNYLLLGEAFGKQPDLLLCNVGMRFEPGKQLLRIDLSEYDNIIDDELRLRKRGYRRKPGAKYLDLRFQNGRFVQRP